MQTTLKTTISFVILCELTFGEAVPIPETFQKNKENNFASIDSIDSLCTQYDQNKLANYLDKLKKGIEAYDNYFTAAILDYKSTNDKEFKKLQDIVDNLQLENASLNETVNAIKDSTKNSIIKMVDNFLRERGINEKEISKLEKEKNDFADKYWTFYNTYSSQGDTISHLRKMISLLSDTIAEYETNKDHKGVYFGIAVGFTYSFHNEIFYQVQTDSVITACKDNSWYNNIGALTTVCLFFRIWEQVGFLASFPIAELKSQKENGMGIINGHPAVGIGVVYYPKGAIQNFGITFMWHISSYRLITFEALRDHKFTEPAFSLLDSEKYGGTSTANVSVSIGVTYDFSFMK